MHLRVLALLAICLTVLPAPAPAQITYRQKGETQDWELIQPLAESASLLPSGEAVYVRTASRVWQTDIAGTQWRAITLPADRVNSLAVHPGDPRVLFAAAGQELHRSEDGGVSWRVVLTTPHPMAVVRVSPADPGLVYVAAGSGSSGSAWRSEDGGLSWEQIHPLTSTASPCSFSFPIVEPDPVVRDRIFLQYGCYAGRNFASGFVVTVSEDAWTSTGTPVFSSLGTQQSAAALVRVVPRRIAFAPDRRRGILVADRSAQEVGGGVLARTDDGGGSWRALLELPLESRGPGVDVAALEWADLAGERLFIGLAAAGRGVWGSEDGGETWGQVGSPSIGAVQSLAYWPALDVLLAASDRGLWRLRNPRPVVAPRGGQGRNLPHLQLTTLLDDPRFEPARLQSFERLQLTSVAAGPGDHLLVAGPPVRLWPDGTLERLLPEQGFPPPMHALAAADASILFSTDTQFSAGGTVNAITPDGEVVQLAGGRLESEPVDPALATHIRLERPRGLAVDQGTGTVYVAESGGHRVRRINPDGAIETVAGTGQPGWPVEGALATETALDEPWALVFDGEGRLLIADRAGQRLVRVETDGTLWTVAGTGIEGYGGDSGPATEARLAYPGGLAVDPQGRIYLADTLNHVVRRVDPDGRIWTVAGTGIPGDAEDGPAAEAPLHTPTSLAWSYGGLAVVELGANRLRWIGPLP